MLHYAIIVLHDQHKELTMIKTIILSLVLVQSAFAQNFEILSYKSDGGNIEMTDSSFTKLWNSDTAVCVKSGSKIMGVNKAYRANSLGYSDCSQSDAKKKEHKVAGIKVQYVKLSTLSPKIMKIFLDRSKK